MAMRKEVVLITGASGEIGHGLIKFLGQDKKTNILAMDVMPIDDSLRPYCFKFIQGDILDQMLLGRLITEFEINTIFHLASILSTKAEHNPELAQRINVEGTINLLRLATEQVQMNASTIKFIYPSSIAAYGIPDLKHKMEAGKVKEGEWSEPSTMYGINKLNCEHLGRYYSRYYRQLAADTSRYAIDFRAIRFPGLISAFTTPSGGTTDYGPEMLHHAARGLPYACFVRPDTRLPFMVMPDAIKALLLIESAPKSNLNQMVYNVTSFSPTAQEICDIVKHHFPNSAITFKVHEKRQNIVDTWPAEIDDSAARRDWGWQPEFNQERSFEDYLVPAIQERLKDE